MAALAVVVLIVVIVEVVRSRLTLSLSLLAIGMILTVAAMLGSLYRTKDRHMSPKANRRGEPPASFWRFALPYLLLGGAILASFIITALLVVDHASTIGWLVGVIMFGVPVLLSIMFGTYVRYRRESSGQQK